jgi:hypothetical protein
MREMPRPDHSAIILRAVQLVFITACLALAWNAPAWDLTASYVAGRLVHAGQAIFIYSPGQSVEGRWPNHAWGAAAALGRLPGLRVTTYVQAPLWAFLMAPFAAAADFTVFKRAFAVLPALAASSMVARASQLWAPAMARPGWQAILLAALFLSTPFITSVQLGQTHVLFLWLTLISAWLAATGRQARAGAVLAFAAFIKISPVWLALAWLAAGRWRAVASFAATILGLAGLTLVLAGVDVCRLFLQQLHEVGAGVLLTFNNDSLAAVLLGGHLTLATAENFQPVMAPAWVMPVSMALTALGAVLAGRFDAESCRRGMAQWGVVPVLVAATAFTPLAWNHYFIVLILPAILFLDAWRRRGNLAWLAVTLSMLVLVIPPLAFAGGTRLWVIALRSEFWAALLALGGLALLARAQLRPGETPMHENSSDDVESLHQMQ